MEFESERGDELYFGGEKLRLQDSSLLENIGFHQGFGIQWLKAIPDAAKLARPRKDRLKWAEIRWAFGHLN